MAGLHDDLLRSFGEDLEETILDPGAWTGLVERVARATGSEGAGLLRTDGTAVDGLSTASLAAVTRRYFDEGWARRDHRARGIPAMRSRGVAVDQDFTAPEELEQLPFYRDLLAPHGLRWFAGIGFEAGGRLWCLTLQRTVREGLFEPAEQARLAHLAPLLRRAALLTEMVETARLAGLIDAFDLVERPALILDAEGRALRWNAAFGLLLGPDLAVRAERLTAREPEAARRLAALARPAGRPAIAAVAVPRLDQAPLALHVIPLTGPSRAVFAGASTLILASDPEAVPVTTSALLRSAFRLTPAEARLAQALAGGATLAQAAERFAIGAATARSQLKAVFAKTGTGRQSDLVRLVAALAR